MWATDHPTKIFKWLRLCFEKVDPILLYPHNNHSNYYDRWSQPHPTSKFIGFTTLTGVISAFPPASWTYSRLGMEPHSGGRCPIFMGWEQNPGSSNGAYSNIVRSLQGQVKQGSTNWTWKNELGTNWVPSQIYFGFGIEELHCSTLCRRWSWRALEILPIIMFLADFHVDSMLAFMTCWDVEPRHGPC